MPRCPGGQTASVTCEFLKTIPQTERYDRRTHVQVDARRRAWKCRARCRFDRHIARVGQQIPVPPEVEFEAAVEDEAGRILEANSGRGWSDPLVDVFEYRMHHSDADVRADSPLFQKMPLHRRGDRINLGPSEISRYDEIAADDANA